MSRPRVEDYTTIDVGGDWPRLRLLCEEPKPRLALECAVRTELARLGYEDGDWSIWWGELHSTVLDVRHKRVFDLLLWDERKHPERQLELALRRWMGCRDWSDSFGSGPKAITGERTLVATAHRICAPRTNLRRA